MSKLSATTQRKAIVLLARCLPNLEALEELNMSAADAFSARRAENLIKSIIETNGFETGSKKGKGVFVCKQDAALNDHQ